jgi:phage terminase small subunit
VLNEKQKRFCEEYLIDLNATQAAVRAGYSKKTAAVIGNENLIKPYIKDYIKGLREKQQEKTGITVSRVLSELAKIGFHDTEPDPKLNDKIKSLELIGKHLGMFSDQTPIAITTPIQIKIIDDNKNAEQHNSGQDKV